MYLEKYTKAKIYNSVTDNNYYNNLDWYTATIHVKSGHMKLFTEFILYPGNDKSYFTSPGFLFKSNS